MAATDLNDLHNFEEHIEEAAVTFLGSATGVDVYRTMIDTNTLTPKIEVRALMSEGLDPPDRRRDGAEPTVVDYKAFRVTFGVSIITDNAIGQTADDHYVYVSKVRAALMISGDNWDGTTLPYYNLAYLKPSGAMADTDGDFCTTTLDYDMIVEIRTDAWPV